MTVRFVLDESSWGTAAATGGDLLSTAVHSLLERLDTAYMRNEGVVRHGEFYSIPIGNGDDLRLYSVLFETDCLVELDRDDVSRLRLALDQVETFDDSELCDCDAEIDGCVHFAPGVVWAHTSCSRGHQVAALPLPLHSAPQGFVPVTVGNDTSNVRFVTDEPQHVAFFRHLISQESDNGEVFEELAGSAFPALEWSDYIWHDIGSFRGRFIDIRNKLIRGLGGLNDHGAACFYKHQKGDPRHLARVLSAQIGFEVSDENGQTKRYGPSVNDRTRRHAGIAKVFWWHIKIEKHVNRIYFRYEPPLVGSRIPVQGRIVVGLFKDHCVLPN